jgi:uncharacterized OB-fold protein
MSHDALKQVGAGEGYVPPQDALTEPWWEATREHRLLLQTCGACGVRQHHPRHVCTACATTDGLGWSESDGAGSVDTFTVVHRPPRPDLEAPYVVARIRLDDGPVLLSTVVGDDALDTTIGDRVRLAWRDLPDGRALPVFEREEG